MDTTTMELQSCNWLAELRSEDEFMELGVSFSLWLNDRPQGKFSTHVKQLIGSDCSSSRTVRPRGLIS